MANKIYNYDTPGDFTYDSDTIEVSGGIAKLKDLIPVNETFYASYNTDINGDRGNGILTGTAYGGASVVGGKLDLAHNDSRYVTYDAVGNADNPQTGCIRFKVTPNYSGNPSSPQYFFAISYSSDYNLIQLYHWPDKTTYILINSNIGVPIIFTSTGIWNPTSGVEYEFEFDYDLTVGATRLFIDGIQFGSTQTGTGTRDNNVVRLRVGTNFNASSNSNFKIDDFVVFSTVQHTTNYTPCPYVECIYCNLKPTIEPIELFDPTHVSSWDSFLETLGGGNEGNIAYNLYKVDKTNKYYWNGSVWVTGGSSSNYNSVNVVNTNIISFDAFPDKIGFVAYLISNGEQKVEIDENQITYPTNLLPNVNAGSNKNCKDNELIKPFSDAVISDPDGDIELATAWYDIEGSGWIQIIKTYPTLQESIREWQYAFNNVGIINCKLKVIDELVGESEDNLDVIVSKYTITFSVKNSQGQHLPTVSFKAGDGTGWQVKDSPFIHNYDYNGAGRNIVIEKAGFGLQTQHIITSEHEENFTLTALGATPEEIYNYFIGGNKEDVFKADVSNLDVAVSTRSSHENPVSSIKGVDDKDLTQVFNNEKGTDGAYTGTPPTVGEIKTELDVEETVVTLLTDIKGATFDTNIDSLEAIRNRGDDAWITGTGDLGDIREKINKIKEKTDTLPANLTTGVAFAPFTFYMVSSIDHVTGMISKTVTGTISKDGAAPVSITNIISEIGGGRYKIANGFTAEEVTSVMDLLFSASGCDDRAITIRTS